MRSIKIFCFKLLKILPFSDAFLGAVNGSIYLFLLWFCIGFVGLSSDSLAEFSSLDSTQLRELNTAASLIYHNTTDVPNMALDVQDIADFSFDVITGQPYLSGGGHNYLTGVGKTGVIPSWSMSQYLHIINRVLGGIDTDGELDLPQYSISQTLDDYFCGWNNVGASHHHAIHDNGVLGRLRDILSEIEDQTDFLDSIDNQLGQISSSVGSMSPHVASIASDVSSIVTDISDLKGYSSDNLAQLQAINQGMSDLGDTVDGLSSLSSDLPSSISNSFDSAIGDVGEDVSDIERMWKGYLSGDYYIDLNKGAVLNKLTHNNITTRENTMSDCLTLIARATGGLDQGWGNSFQSSTSVSLIESILGWSSSKEPTTFTNGVLRKLDYLTHLQPIRKDTSNIYDAVSLQLNVISQGFARVTQQLDDSLSNQTNMLYLQSQPYLIGKNNYQDFVNLIAQGQMLAYTNQNFTSNPFLGMMLQLPDLTQAILGFGIVPRRALIAAAQTYGFTPSNGQNLRLEDIESLAKRYYKHYGNLADYAALDDDYGYESGTQATNLVNSVVVDSSTNREATLTAQLDVTELAPDWQEFRSIESDWKGERGPGNSYFSRIEDYFAGAITEDSTDASYSFSIDFGGEEGVYVDIEDVDLLGTVDNNIILAGQNVVNFGSMIIKALLTLLFVWRIAEHAVDVIDGRSVA